MALMGQNVTTNGGSGLAATYPSLSAAITALNVATLSGAQTIITLNQDEIAPVGGYLITVQGNVNNQVIIRGAGTTPTVTVTAFSPQASGVIHDAIFEIVGGDWITIENFKMRENPANTITAVGSNTMTEWGVALLYGFTNNGAKNNTVRNNEISLNRMCRNTFGIYSNSTHAANSPGSLASPVLATGNNSGLTVQGNRISNVNTGIVVVGPSADEAAYNDLVTIGGPTAAQGNTITDYGTNTIESIYTNLSSPVNGIIVRYARNYDISNNTITSSAGDFTATSTLRGIYVQDFNTAPTGTLVQTINNNSISLRHGGTLGIIMGIRVDAATSSATSSLSISGNDFHTTGHTVASPSGAVTFISVGSGTATCAITDNTFTDLTVSSSGNLTFLTTGTVAIPDNGSRHVDNNRIVGSFIRTATSGTVVFYSATGASSSTATESNTGNNFSNVHLSGTTTLSAAWVNTGGSATKTVADNVFANWSLPTSNVLLMTLSGGAGSTASNNMIMHMAKTAGAFTGITSTGWTLSGNTIRNIIGAGAVTGIASTSSIVNTNTIEGITGNGADPIIGISSTTSTASGNTISDLVGTSSGAVIGISSGAAGDETFEGNTIRSLRATGATASTVIGVRITAGTTKTVARNRIHGLWALGTNGLAKGIVVTGGTTVNIYNNLIGDLNAPATSESSVNQVIGVELLGTGTFTTRHLSYNTLYLNATSTGNNFGTSGVYHQVNATATTNQLALRNNIIVNTSAQNGTGRTVAFRRSGAGSGTLSNYGPGSNYNLFHAGTPGPGHYIYSDGTNHMETLIAYTTFGPGLAPGTLTPRDQSSITEVPSFLSVDGTHPDFLHIDPSIPTQIEGGGQPVGSPVFISTDYDGDTRNFTTPDIGADEFAGIAGQLAPPTIVYTPLSAVNACVDGVQTLTATITSNNPGGSIPTSGAGLPQLRWRVVGGTWAYVTGTHVGGNDYTFSFSGGSTGTVEYYVVARDSEGAMATQPYGGGGFSIAPAAPAASNAPAVPSSYTTLYTLNGTYQVGTSGPAHFTTLSQAVAVYNTACLGGPVVFELIDASYTNVPPAETFPITIANNPAASAVNTLTIRPSGQSSIHGSLDAPLIAFDGARYVTIDGVAADHTAPARLIIANAATGSSANAIRFVNGAQHNAVTNCTVRGASQATAITQPGAVIAFWTTTGPIGNSNNTVSHCRIRNTGLLPVLFDPYSSLPTRGIWSSGSADLAQHNSENLIEDNQVFNYFIASANQSRGIVLGAGNHKWTIAGNRLFQETARVYTAAGNHRIIDVDAGTGTTDPNAGEHTVQGNILGFASGTGAGVYSISALSNNVRAIYFDLPNANPRSTITANVIDGIDLTSTGVGSGTTSPQVLVYINNGQVDVDDNRIGDIDGEVATVILNANSSAVQYGIFNNQGTGFRTRGNRIGGISSSTGYFSALHNLSNTAWECARNVVGGNAGIVAPVGGANNAELYGIFTTAGILTADTNTVANLSVWRDGNTTNPVVRGIALAGGGPHVLTGNTIHQFSSNKTNTGQALGGEVTGIYSTVAATVTRNAIHDLSANGTQTNSSTLVRGIWTNGPDAHLTARDNTIDTLRALCSGSSTFTNSVNGIRAEGDNATIVVENNRVSHLRVNDFTSAFNDLSVDGGLIGINVVRAGGTSSANVTNNLVYDIENSSTRDNRVYAVGIRVVPRGTSTLVSRNTVHSIRATRGTGSNAIQSHPTGIWLATSLNGAAASTSTVVNNMVRLGIDPDGTQENWGYAARGIWTGVFADAASNVRLYFNSVYIGGEHVTNTSAQLSHALYSANTATRDIRNNIFWNARNIAGTHYAMEVPTANLTSNNNDLRVSGSIGERHVARSGADFTTLGSWQTPTRDNLSISVDAPFVAPTGNMASVDLHLDVTGTNTNLFNAGGVTIPGHGADIDGDPRQTPPDIGADEICGTGNGPFSVPTTWYPDADEDGYGDPSESVTTCDTPVGYVANGDDCDDTDPNLTQIGNACNDGDPETVNDIVQADCTCLGEPFTGIGEDPEASWPSVFPNPSNGTFTVAPAGPGPLEMTVHDALGRTVVAPFVILGPAPVPLSIEQPASGTYFLRTTGAAGTKVFHLMIIR